MDGERGETMRHRSSIRSVLSFAAIFWLVFSSSAFAGDTLPISGERLSDQEMSEIRGGLTLPGGDFLYFSMEYMKLNLVSHNEPDSGSPYWVNALNQQVVLTENGEIGVALKVLQSGGGDGDTGALGQATQLNSILVNDSFSDFSGICSANFITGNNNTASIINVLNFKVGFFSSENLKTNQIQEFLFH
jgi:hypothetical protein